MFKRIVLEVDITEATYYYQIKRLEQEDSNQSLKKQTKTPLSEFKERYGFKQITTELKQLGYCVNHKKVYYLMKTMGVKFMRKSRKYNSYKGTVAAIAKNRLNRRFYTPIALQKLITDVTEFKCTNGEKLYLSPILDLYNGEMITYGINNGPTLDLVMAPLEEAVDIIKEHANVRTTIHSNQGWHYQHTKEKHYFSVHVSQVDLCR